MNTPLSVLAFALGIALAIAVLLLFDKLGVPW